MQVLRGDAVGELVQVRLADVDVARALFKYSLLYLALLFVAMAADPLL